MNSLTAYALSKKIASSAVSGVSAMSVDGTTLNIDTNDGQRLQVNFPIPKDGEDGVSVVDIDLNANHELTFFMSDGTEIVAGQIEAIKSETGNVYFAAFKVVNGRLIMYSDPTVDKVCFVRSGSRLKYRLAM